MVQTRPLTPAQPEPLAAAPGRRAGVVDALIIQTLIVFCWVAWLVPWPVWHLATGAAGALGMAFGWRRVVLANVRHARAAAPPPALVAWYLGAQQIATHCKTVIGMLRAGVRPPDPADRLVFEGLEHLEGQLGRRGIVLVAPHAGPYPTLGLMASRWLHGRGFGGELVVVARLFRPFRSGALMAWFVRCFARAGATIVSVDESPRRLGSRLRRTLEANGIVVLLVDEPTPTPSAAVPFFDSEIRLPLGPVRLAQATGSVILPCIATYGRGRRVTLTFAPPIEPEGPATTTLARLAGSLQSLVGPHLDQWAMLTPVWPDAAVPPPGHADADLHLHTVGSDGLLRVGDWVGAAAATGVKVVAITDHDHLETVRGWKAGPGGGGPAVLPGVELTARGRIVHLGVLFPEELPAGLPKPGTPLPELVRWARSVPGSVTVLVHPLPFLWRRQLRGLARAGALPDAIESRFPLVGWRQGAIERAAAAYGLATLGGSDAHLAPRQLGRYATRFPGETAADLVAAIRAGTTRAVARPDGARPPLAVYALQCVYSWLLPFQGTPAVDAARVRLLGAARRRANAGVDGAVPPGVIGAERAEEGLATG